MRDSLLFAAGELDTAAGGRAVDILSQPFSHRRTIYGFVDRQNLPNLYRSFDFASPDQTAPMRFANTVPQQALFMMNSPFIVEQSKALARRVREVSAPADKIRGLYRIAFARTPSDEEIAVGLAFIDNEMPLPVAAAQGPVWQYGFGSYDESAQRMKSFTKLPTFTGNAYQGGKALPDARLGWCLITAQGGHAGNDLEHAVVRRVPAPGVPVGVGQRRVDRDPEAPGVGGEQRPVLLEAQALRHRAQSADGPVVGTTGGQVPAEHGEHDEHHEGADDGLAGTTRLNPAAQPHVRTLTAEVRAR